MREIEPAIVAGFGGYPTIPPVFAARIAGVPILVHDANGVVGRANKLLLRLGANLALGMTNAEGSQGAVSRTVTGNPVRRAVLAAAEKPYFPPKPGDEIRLLIFGGSQGAHFFSETIPNTVGLLPAEIRDRLSVIQQCRPEDIHEVRAAYENLKIGAELAPFFDDLAAKIADAHLVISRSGASTVTELAVIGRPAILVPYPYALDHDQAANAELLRALGGAVVLRQADIDQNFLANLLAELISDPGKLRTMAEGAKRGGHADAVDKIADLIERLADGDGKKF